MIHFRKTAESGSIFKTLFLGLLTAVMHLNDPAKGQITRNLIKIDQKGP